MANNSTRYRSHQERIEAIFSFIESQDYVFPKSRLKEIGLNPRTAEAWLKLIEYIQNQPRIRLIQSDHNLLVEKVEGKYQALMRKMSLDEKVPFEQRMQFLTDYLKTLYTREKTKNTENSVHSWSKNSISLSNPQDLIVQLRDALNTLTILDPKFETFIPPLNEISSNSTAEQALLTLTKWHKVAMLDKKFQSLFNQVIEKQVRASRERLLAKLYPDFAEKLKLAERTIQAHYSFLRDNMADWFFK